MEQATHFHLPRLSILMALAIVVGGLYAGRDVLVPLALAVLFSFLLAPLVARLERYLGRIAAVILAVAIATAVVAGVGFVIGHQLTDIASKLPEYRVNIEKKVFALRGVFGHAVETMKDISTDLSGKHSPSPGGAAITPVPVQTVEQPSALQFFQYLIGPLLGPLETMGIVIVFVIFMLLEREALRDRLLRLVGHQDLNLTTQAIDDAANRISRYLLLQLVVNCAYGAGVTLGLYLFGVPNAPVWGALTAFMRFIPYVGTWIAACFPFVLSMATTEGLQPLYVFLLYLGLELSVPTFIEPLLYGSSTGVSALALLVSALFWSFLWGLPGLFLSMPITVCLMVIGRYVPQLSFFDILLNDRQVLDTRERLYQRLLSMNIEEATDVVEEELKCRPLVEIFDNLLMPTLTMAEFDRRRGRLDERHDAFIRESVLELSEDLLAQTLPSEGVLELGFSEGMRTPPSTPAREVICLPARTRDDAVAAGVVSQYLQLHHVPIQASMPVNPIRDGGPAVTADIICIVALPPAALTHARYLYKRMKARHPHKTFVVCPWGSKLASDEIRNRLRCEPTDAVVTTIADLVAAIQELTQRIPQPQSVPAEVLK
jgi:predicted PurR-regulated permease PerM